VAVLATLLGGCRLSDVSLGTCEFEYDDAHIARVDPHGGTRRWVAERPWVDDRLRAVHDENTVWTWSTLSGSELIAHDLTSGAERWRWLPDSDMFTVAKVDDTLVVHAVGKVIGLDPDTGEPRWTYVGESPDKFASTPQHGDQQWSPPAEMLDGPVVLNDNGTVIAIDPASGSELWRASTAGSTSIAPMVAGDLVLHPADPGVLHAFDVARGSERWAWGAPDDQQLSARVDTVGELVVVSTSVLGPTNAAVSGELVALDQVTGNVTWARPFLPFYDWAWNVTDETLVVRSARLDGTTDSSATLTRIDLTTGRDLWTRDIVSLVNE
jgi:outer membrane protein assembly factor BamB